MTRIRTLEFLPSIFQTPTNSQFLGATLDQLVNPPVTKKLDGYIGSKLGYGIDANDYYVTEPTKVRKDYQLEPGIVFTKKNESVAKDFISYPGILDALKLQNGITDNNDRLFQSQFYSWDSFTNLDMLINFNQYYWLPEGLPSVTVASDTVFRNNDFIVLDLPNAYNIRAIGAGAGSDNPTLTLIRGGTYTFTVNQNTGFWIQGEPGVSGYSPIQPNLYTRNVYGVTNNGASEGIITFSVPQKDAQNDLELPGNNRVDIVCNQTFDAVNGKLLSQINNIDGVTSLNGRTILFYNQSITEIADLGAYDLQQYDQTQTALSLSYDTDLYISNTSENFYTITYLPNDADPNDPFVIFIPSGLIPVQEKITVNYGTAFIGLNFYKDGSSGFISEIPYISAPLDKLYYQDSTNPNKVGVIRLIESNNLNTLNVETEILGKQNFTSLNGITFTNGLKVSFDGDVLPRSYLQGEYYVEGVGTAIELIPVTSLIVPESYTDASSIPYDSLPYDIGNYDSALYIPLNQDYITIARNSNNLNPWSRSNRWFHIQVIQDTATYLNNPDILTTYGNANNKAKRPIIEFYPNLKLFNSGTIAKSAVDFVDNRTTNPFVSVAGQATYYPDIETYTNYNGTILPNPTVYTGGYIPGQQYKISQFGPTITDGPNSSTVLQTWIDLGLAVTYDGDFVPGIEYIIWELGTTDWNEVAGTSGLSYARGDIFTAVNPGTIVGSGGGTALPVLFIAQTSGQYNSNDLLPGTEYFIDVLGSTPWTQLGALSNITVTNCSPPSQTDNLIPGTLYVITDLGNLSQAEWNVIAGTSNVTYEVGSRFVCSEPSVVIETGTAGIPYLIADLGEISQNRWNILAGTTGVTYKIGDLFVPLSTFFSPRGSKLIPVQFTTNTLSSGLRYKSVGTGSAYQGSGRSVSQTTTLISIDSDQVTGSLIPGMYINDVIFDEQSQLPPNTRILSISGTDTYTMEVFWSLPTIIQGTDGDAGFVASTKNNSDLELFSGARIVFAAETNPILKNKIYVVNFATIDSSYPVITLTEAVDGEILENDQFVVLRGQNNQGQSYYFLDDEFILAQFKPDININPKFDVYDKEGISFGNSTFYNSSTFIGNDLFRYKIGTGANDTILGFPISYSSINNVGDIRFDVALNSDTFDYVGGISQNEPITENVNNGFVRNYITRDDYTLLTGWQTAVAPSVQYQVFEFNYEPNNPIVQLETGETISYQVICDVPTLSRTDTTWPNLQVYNNNTLLILDTDYTVEFNTDNTAITVYLESDTKTVIQVLLLSDKVSSNAYYSIPINLSNNPFNTDITSVDIGDIRGHYQTIFTNNPNTSGVMFGSNNTRDLGNIVPYGTRIIQNSASLVLPGAFLRNADFNLFDALEYNSREYIKFKTLLVDTVNKTSFQQKFDPAFLLDDVLDQIASVKNQDMPFFWSDMLPNKAAYITNTYKLQNDIETTTYPLNQIYNFKTANYNGVLVYLITTINGLTVTKQLYKNIDYIISEDSPSVTITKNLIKGDQIVIKEYNQTYGSYVPNTPSKLGLYPVSIPAVVLDNTYTEPTYFILGHDGSYNKLYGEYLPETNLLVDYRDQVLLEFEIRIYNNLKLSNTIPIIQNEIIPGYFRSTDFTYDEWLYMYSPQFLNWIGQNRLDYKTQIYLNTNPYTFNYKNSRNKLDNTLIQQGNWHGIYQYYFDTSTPNITPWEMIGYVNKPDWWEEQYGPAPYTSNNLVLWQDMENGYDYNNGIPFTSEKYKRPGLLTILPVDDEGNLTQPLYSVVGNYNANTLRRDWMIGDDAPVEFSYRRSSTYPFDVMRLQALMQPAKFFNLCVDVDNYKYNSEFNQYLFNDRKHLIINEVQVYGDGIAKTSYINWIVDYEKQFGIGATDKIVDLLNNLDVRLVNRLAGFSDKSLLKFFVEKGSPDSRNASLLIPDESYSVLLYQNVPYDKIVYSSVVIQLDSVGYRVFGNSQNVAYFKILKPVNNNNRSRIVIQDAEVTIANDYSKTIELVPYGTTFYSIQELSQFLASYGAYLQSQGMQFKEIESGIEVNWQQMIAEFLYWTQVGWEIGSIITVNPCANTILIDKESQIVQPLTLQQTNFILNQNLYPINNKDLSIVRDSTKFSATTLNQGDTISYAQFNMSNIEHGIVFDNETLFNDTIYNLVTGLKQNRIYSRGTKSAEWNGTMFASGFIYNQDNIQEWTGDLKYTKGSIVEYKNKYWTALKIIQPSNIFNEIDWKETDYNEIQKGLLPNSSTRSYESSLYYNVDKANLEQDADQLSFSLIGFRPRPYMASADLTDITQVNVYKNMIKEKGTRNVLNAFKNAQLPQGGIDYDIYENWAILQGTFGGTLNSNFVEFKVNQNKLTNNPSIVALTDGQDTEGAQQLVPIYSLFNYQRPINNVDVLPTINNYVPNTLFPDAGYVNRDDVKMSAYFYSNLPTAVDKNNIIVPLSNLYVNDYVWLADYLSKWQILTPYSIGNVIQVRANLDDTSTLIFEKPHNLNQYDIFAIINFDDSVNGYYIAAQIINPYQILINLTLSASNRIVTGQGIALGFNSQRVSQPSDIQDTALLNYEFTKNKIWVDTNTDGDWAVYLKTNNYKYDHEFTKENSERFGTAVNYTINGDFLISDPNDNTGGKVYRYQYDVLTNEYNEDQILAGAESFGAVITNGQNIIAISSPTSTIKYVGLYVVNDTQVTDDIILYQTISGGQVSIIGPVDSTNFGSSLTFSQDTNLLFVSDFDEVVPVARNKVQVYRKNNINLPATSMVLNRTYQITEIGTTDFTEYGAVENKVGIYFIARGPAVGTGQVRQTNYVYVATIDGPNTTVDKFANSISTNNDGSILVVGAPYEDFDGSISRWGHSYVYQRLVQKFEASNSETNTSYTLSWTPDNTKPVAVYINGNYLQATSYTISGPTLTILTSVNAGDIIEFSGNEFVLIQTLETENTPRIGVQFGNSVDINNAGTEILIGAPFALTNNVEGAVYRYTYGSARFGYITGNTEVNVTANRTLLINGYSVNIPVGNALTAELAINSAGITNVTATSNNNILSISLINENLAQVNQELIIGVTDPVTLTELGLQLFTQTQTILCPHIEGPTQFGTTIKFNEHNSFVVSAPVADRFALTTFDFTDDTNLDNDTVFDNNSTQFLDVFPNAGAVYMYDYLENYNESISNIGAYTYAQSCNAKNLDYGQQPYYGTALDFADNKVVIGTPNYRPEDIDGQVIVYENLSGSTNWSVYRQSSPVVDIDRIQNTQLFSAETNNTLINLDYMDPLQGKLLGAIRQNINVVSNTDPASYNNANNTQSGFVWGTAQLGTIWFDTTNVRFINYHQNDNGYNARYWGTLFPGSDVAIYSWVASDVTPADYAGPGTPKDISLFTVQTVINASNEIKPVYYFWVRNSGIIFSGKSLADITIAEYINNPQGSGIAYMAPVLPNAFALYNCQTFINANDSVLHIGYGTGSSNDIAHQEFCLIRENFASDYLPGFPNVNKGIDYPESLYDRFLDSLSGTDEEGQVVPDPFLPKAVQSGILARPKQSFVYNRFLALNNYLEYVNTILSQFPITELRRPTYLDESGTYFNTQNYWEYVNWWADGFNDNTKSIFQVQIYADLTTLNVSNGTIVTVAQNSEGFNETYIYEDGIWNRIGLQNGTIRFKSELYDYQEGQFGFGGDFFSTSPFDSYPSEETRWILRAINEQIFTNDLLIYRNQSLILLFEYIVSETDENQNYLPWLNKTSLVDVGHTIRELLPLENFQSDNQEFLSGYVNEAKPYHVVVKEFLFNYTGNDIYQGNMTDFDLPATYDTTIDKFVSPQLVYNNPNTEYEFLPSDPVWQKPEYDQWFENYGVSLVGQNDYLITKLASYVTLGSDFIIVDNAQGFPINGVIKIADIADPTSFEYIGYNSVDRALNALTGLIRGMNGTLAMDHLPGENIYIDLPAVVVLDGGRSYADPPRVIAYIDETKYPAPREEAVLEAVMSLDSVLSINVVNPGSGYAVLPEIIIEPSETFEFTSGNVNIIASTIEVYAPSFQTGDLARYISGTTNIGGLQNNQNYYVNVLDTTPTSILALYTTYKDAINDTNRVRFLSNGTGTQKLELGAKASAISSSYPIRENNITVKFDRTTYNSQVIDWTPGRFYAAPFNGSYTNIENSASSSLELYDVYPNINTILASNGGVVFPIVTVDNDSVTEYSTFERKVISTVAGSNILTLDVDVNTDNASGSTIGFTIGMPIKFVGTVGASLLVSGTEYYINEIVSDTEFKISATVSGPVYALGNASNLNLVTTTAQVTNTAELSVLYPGIRQVTATSSANNNLFIPLTAIGTGGTQGMYTGLPIMFTGNVFSNIEDNVIYYVVSVLDEQNFTISETDDILSLEVTSINAANQLIMPSVVGLNVNDKVVFNTMIINGSDVTDFGGIIQGQIYYIKEIGVNVLTLSLTLGGSEVPLTPVTEASNTFAYMISQENNFDLSDGTGIMDCNIQLPVSPGQVNGQQFTLYQTSGQYADITATVFSNLVEKDIEQTLQSLNAIAINGDASRLYTGLSFGISANVGGLYNNKVYEMADIGNIEIDLQSTRTSSCTLNATFDGTEMTVTVKTGSGFIYPGAVISGTGLANDIYVIEQVSGPTGETGVYIVDHDFITIESFTGLISNTGIVRVVIGDNTNTIYENMPITFSGIGLGGIVIGQQYYVRYIIDSENFIISVVKNSRSVQLASSSGTMQGIGSTVISAYLNAGDFVIGDDYDIRTIGNTDFTLIGATLDINNAGGFTVGETYIIQDLGTTLNATWNIIAGTTGINYQVGDVFVCVTSSSGPGDGAAYVQRFTATGTGIGTGTATVILSNSDIESTLTQEITVNPVLDISYIMGGYRAIINNGGKGFTVDNVITIPGSQVGGISTSNDVILTVNQINSIVEGEYSWSLPLESDGTITKVICSGTPAGTNTKYWLKVVDANTFKVYSDPLLQVSVSGINFPYTGFTMTTATAITESNDSITVTSSTDFNINDPVVFSGNVFSTEITLGETYYIYDKPTSTSVRLTDNPGGSIIDFTSDESGSMIMTKAGSFIVLPQPFFFNQSIVKYNNRVYACVISNNDDEFVFGKWEELGSGDSRLNAMDRVKGWYQPTVNMPGNELQQLFTGVTYPNTTYKGNDFNPADQFNIDTILQDQIFYPTNVDMVGIVYNGVNYIAPVNLPNYSGFAADIEVTDDWLLAKIADKPMALSDIIKTDKYVLTTNNSATPILTSNDGKVWSANGFYVPYDTAVEDIPYVKKKLISTGLTFNKIAHSDILDIYVVVGSNIATSDNLALWIETFEFDSGVLGEFYDVQFVNTNFFTGFIAVGMRNNNKFIVYSNDGLTWSEVQSSSFSSLPAFSSFENNVLYSLSSNDNFIIAAGDQGVIYKATAINNWILSEKLDESINSMYFAQNTFVAAGNNGLLARSSDGVNYTTIITDTTEDLNFVTYTIEKSEWTIGGDNNTVLQTSDITDTPVVWNTVQIFSIPKPAYTIQGDSFSAGYGPEELVPGVVTDQLTMLVKTRAGTNWSATEYAHVGYNTISIELNANIDNSYSFADIVETPIQISVFETNNGLSTALIADVDYTVDWINKTVELMTNITGTTTLRIDVYEVGNGDQLVKSSTDFNPIVFNAATGFNEIYLDCNYSGQRITGGGIVQPNTDPIVDTATATNSANDTITVSDISNFVLNGQIYFAGDVFGGVTENTPYYVKSINTIRSQITISDTINSGIAGSVFEVATETGNMDVVIQTGPGEFYTEPAVYKNGNKLIAGRTNIVFRSQASNNSFVTYNTAGLIANQKIRFGYNAIGGVGQGLYYIKDIIDGSQFTISETINGSVVPLINQVGNCKFITEDFAVDVANNGITAKMIIPGTLDQDTDYLAYSFLAETEPSQYGYTLPETEYITGNDISVYSLSNYINEENALNAIVEVDGLRIMPNQYTISPAFNNITFDTLTPNSSQTIAVTTFNDTQRQYLNTQYQNSSIQVTAIIYVDNVITPTHKTVTITTSIPHNLSDNDVIRIDDVNGSYQLNNQVFIINVISATEFDIYEYIPGNTYQFSAPITDVNTYTSGGYVWLAYSWIVYTTVASGSLNSEIITFNVDSLVVDTPVIFTEENIQLGNSTSISEIIAGTTYYVRSIDSINNSFTISETRNGNILTLANVTPASSTWEINHLLNTQFVSVTPIFANNQAVTGRYDYPNVYYNNANTLTLTFDSALTGYAAIVGDSSDSNSYYLHNQSVSNTTWTVNHNLNTQYVTVAPATANDLSWYGRYDGPNITYNNSNTLTLTFSSAQTGNVAVIGDNGDGYFVYNQPTSSNIWTVTHNLNAIYVGVTPVYSNNMSMVGTYDYPTITFDNANTLTLSFDTAQAGNVVIVGGGTNSASYYQYTQPGKNIKVSQWEQTNVDRLWVTVNGYRVASSQLRLNPANELSILTPINVGDEVIITSMMPSATPDENTYINIVDTIGNGTVYRANGYTRTWVKANIGEYDTSIEVQNIDRVTNKNTQTDLCPSAVLGNYIIPLDASKNDIVDITVYNNNILRQGFIRPDYINLTVTGTGPYVSIDENANIQPGDSLTIVTYEGNLIYVNGEYMRIEGLDTDTNTLYVQRGAIGSGVQVYIPKYAQVYSLLEDNEMTIIDYNTVWNPIPGIYNQIKGDPLQIANSPGANFLKVDV